MTQYPIPPQPSREQYPRRATADVRDSMASALRVMVEEIRFQGAEGADRFAEVFDDWPSYNERYVPPSACVLPGDFRFSDWSSSPTLLENTWWPQGLPGWGLYKTAEVAAEFSLLLRTNLPGERRTIMRAVEDAFQDPALLMDHVSGARYGLLHAMETYYGVSARFALLGGSVIDSEDKAMRDQREAIFTISATAPKVQVGPVFPLALQVRVRVNDDSI